MNKIIICCLITIFFAACYSADKPPAEVIKSEQMKNILWDLMTAQALASQLSMKDSSINQALETKRLSEKVFSIHHTDSASFNNSYNWYVKHPQILKRIFDSLYSQKQREDILKSKVNHKDAPIPEK